jgi:hypothetical protein
MKLIPLALAAGLAVIATSALAQPVCTGNALSMDQINAIIGPGNTVCGRPGAGYPGGAGSADRWQEEHVAGGQLWDYKRGPGHAVDPRKQVGTWSTAAASRTQGTISHIYGPTVAFTWVMYGPTSNSPGASVYSFCSGGAEHVRAFVRTGSVPCATYP